MRTLTIIAIATLALVVFATPSQADSVTVGDCKKFGGACAGVCVDATTPCQDGALVCAGVSYQVPQCVGTGLTWA